MLFYVQFCPSNDQTKETFLDENNCKFNSYKLSHKLAFIPFCHFVRTKNNNPFLGSWWSGNKKYFYILFITLRALFQRHVNSFIVSRFNQSYKIY